MSRRRTRSSASNADLTPGIDAGPRNPPRGSGLRTGAKTARRYLSSIQTMPFKLNTLEKGPVTVGYYTGYMQRGEWHGMGTIHFLPTYYRGS